MPYHIPPHFDPNNRDEFGYDPFSIRSLPNPARDISFAEILKANDYAKTPIEKSNDFQNDEWLIANHAHYIYVVNPLSSETRLKTIEEYKRNNPDHITALWVEKSTYTEEAWQKLITWAKTNKIHLLDITDAMKGRMGILEGLYNFERMRRWPARASDIVRLFILKKFAGAYMDTDVVNIEPLGDVYAEEGLLVSYKPRKFYSGATHALATDKKTPIISVGGGNNDILFCRSENKYVDDLIGYIQENYKKTNEELFPDKIDVVTTNDEIKKETYADVALDLDNKSYKRNTTIMCTGPSIIFKLIRDKKKRALYETDVLDHFIFGSELSWLKSNPHQPKLSEDDAIAIIVSAVIFELEREPRVLRLDINREFYSPEVFSSPESVDNVLQSVIGLLTDYYPDLLKKVEVIDCADIPIERILNHNYFPALDRKRFAREYLAANSNVAEAVNILMRYDQNGEFNTTIKEHLSKLVVDHQKNDSKQLKDLLNAIDAFESKYQTNRELIIIFKNKIRETENNRNLSLSQIESEIKDLKSDYIKIEKVLNDINNILLKYKSTKNVHLNNAIEILRDFVINEYITKKNTNVFKNISDEKKKVLTLLNYYDRSTHLTFSATNMSKNLIDIQRNLRDLFSAALFNPLNKDPNKIISALDYLNMYLVNIIKQVAQSNKQLGFYNESRQSQAKLDIVIKLAKLLADDSSIYFSNDELSMMGIIKSDATPVDKATASLIENIKSLNLPLVHLEKAFIPSQNLQV